MDDEGIETFCANLSTSVKQAISKSHSINTFPLLLSIPSLALRSGAIAALYPTRFLEPNDPMISRTLDLMLQHSQEDEYTYFNRKKIWTYLTADWAMCYLLRDDLATFNRLFDGYVAHASPTNAWIEEMFIESRLGTGDMPHGWAAAQYVHLHRNALVFEDKDVLHLCFGG